MPDPKRPLSEGKVAALMLLKQALDDAEDVGKEVRQFAISKQQLIAVGAAESDLLWLITQRFVEHLRDVTADGQTQREFRAATAPALRDNSCFVLTHLGKVYIERNGLTSATRSTSGLKRSLPERTPAKRIRWDTRRHELWVDGRLVKRFARAAPAQWAVLDTFESRGWQSPVEGGAFGSHERDRGQRLRELVAELNKRLERSLIEFRKDCVAQRITFDLRT